MRYHLIACYSEAVCMRGKGARNMIPILAVYAVLRKQAVGV